MQPERIIRQSIENLKLAHPELLEDDEAWTASLESETDFNEVLTAIVRRIEDTRALASGTKERLDELKARKDRFEHRIGTLRDLAFRIMAAAEIAKLELSECTLSLRAGQPRLIGDADPGEMPDYFCKVSRELNHTAIKQALKDGRTVPGFELSNAPPSLTIRIK